MTVSWLGNVTSRTFHNVTYTDVLTATIIQPGYSATWQVNNSKDEILEEKKFTFTAMSSPIEIGVTLENIDYGSFEKMEKGQLRELLVKNWMTHDALWFANSVKAIGIHKANVINRNAVKAMAQIEAKRLKAALNIEELNSFTLLKDFINEAFMVVRGDFMKFTVSFPDENIMTWEMSACFAFNGVKKLGVIEEYQCGIFDRLEGWFHSLGVEYTETPQFQGCLMHQQGNCERNYHFKFGS